MKTNFGAVEIARGEVAHRLIADKIREQILSGEIAPGFEMPSTAHMAEIWKTSMSTMHIALKNLVKEGLLERRHGSGTYVRERPRSLDRVGIYYGDPCIWTDEESAFYRSLYGILEKKLGEANIEFSIFVDRRHAKKQNVVLPSLRRAVDTGEIQGLIVPMASPLNLPVLLKLPVPVGAMTGAIGISNKVGMDDKKFFRNILARLKSKGCRTVGLINSVNVDMRSVYSSEAEFFTDDFRREVAAQGMITKEEWLRAPEDFVKERALFGYNEFHQLWRQAEHPDAVIVYPDMVVKGVILAALELGVHQSKEVTFCFHRNARVSIMCPFPALWAISDEEKIAEALIGLVRTQHAGGKVSPIRVPFEFKSTQKTLEILA